MAYGHPDTPIEPLIYTQTSPDIPEIARQLEALAVERGGKDQVKIVVDSSESMSWPWAWYLRDFTNATYVDQVDRATVPEGAVLLLWDGTLRAKPNLGDGYPVAEPYVHRWWFPEEGYRGWTRASISPRAADGTLFLDMANFYWNGENREYLGTLGGVALFPVEPPAARLPTSGVSYGR